MGSETLHRTVGILVLFTFDTAQVIVVHIQCVDISNKLG